MKKQPEHDTESGDRPVLIEVTPQMVEAGLSELREHHFGGDLAYIVECVFRAMVYARDSASTTSART
jgi:hypothetical protein